MKEKDIDALDRAILGALLEDGRLSQVELVERIPLSYARSRRGESFKVTRRASVGRRLVSP